MQSILHIQLLSICFVHAQLIFFEHGKSFHPLEAQYMAQCSRPFKLLGSPPIHLA